MVQIRHPGEDAEEGERERELRGSRFCGHEKDVQQNQLSDAARELYGAKESRERQGHARAPHRQHAVGAHGAEAEQIGDRDEDMPESEQLRNHIARMLEDAVYLYTKEYAGHSRDDDQHRYAERQSQASRYTLYLLFHVNLMAAGSA